MGYYNDYKPGGFDLDALFDSEPVQEDQTEISVTATIAIPHEWSWQAQDVLEEALKEAADVAQDSIEDYCGLRVTVNWHTVIGEAMAETGTPNMT